MEKTAESEAERQVASLQQLRTENFLAARAALEQGRWRALAERADILKRVDEQLARLKAGGYAGPDGKPVRGARG